MNSVYTVDPDTADMVIGILSTAPDASGAVIAFLTICILIGAVATLRGD